VIFLSASGPAVFLSHMVTSISTAMKRRSWCSWNSIKLVGQCIFWFRNWVGQLQSQSLPGGVFQIGGSPVFSAHRWLCAVRFSIESRLHNTGQPLHVAADEPDVSLPTQGLPNNDPRPQTAHAVHGAHPQGVRRPVGATPAPNFICMTTKVLAIYIRVGGFSPAFPLHLTPHDVHQLRYPAGKGGR